MWDSTCRRFGQPDKLAREGEIAFDVGLFCFKGQELGTSQANIKRYTVNFVISFFRESKAVMDYLT